MRIGIIGPNKFEYLARDGARVSIDELKKMLDEIAMTIAKSGCEIVLTPDKNSLLAFLGRKYIENKGKKIYEIVPLDDDYEKYLDTSLGEIISCGKWPLQPSKFNEECDIIVCVGYGGMVMAEIGFSRYYNPKTIYIIEDLVSAKLPREIERSLDLKYISYKNLKRILK